MEKIRSRKTNFKKYPTGRNKNEPLPGAMSIPDIYDISPLQGEPFIPKKADGAFYLETSCRWIFQNKFELREDEKAHQLFPDIFSGNIPGDYEIEHAIFPHDPAIQEDIRNWEPILKKDLSEENRILDRRSFSNAPSHHVFLIAILDTIREKLSDFLYMYAKKRNVDKFFNDPFYDGELKAIQYLRKDLKEFIDDMDLQLIPHQLYHHNWCGYVMSENTANIEMVEERFIPDRVFEFGFSKKTSDVFTEGIIEILEAWELLISDRVNKPGIRIKPNSKQQDNPNYELINLPPVLISWDSAIIEKAHDQLKSFFQEDERILLLELFNGKKTEHTLFFNGSCVKLADYFFQLHFKKKIGNPVTVTARWLCENFKYSKRGSPSPFDYGNTLKVLYRQNQISSQRRILFES